MSALETIFFAERVEDEATRPDLDSVEAARPDTDSVEAARPDIDSTEATRPDTDSTEVARPDTDWEAPMEFFCNLNSPHYDYKICIHLRSSIPDTF